MPPSKLLTLRGRTNAVVFTRYPVHPWQFATFNTRFYHALESKAVEQAVRDARLQLAEDQPLNDAAGFGWITLVTGPTAGMRIVAPSSVPAGDPRDMVTRQPETQPTSAGAAAPSAPGAGPRDAFEGFG
jgi:hypothetical protein